MPGILPKALNNHPSKSEKVKESVKKKAIESNYKHNSERQSTILNSIFIFTVKNTFNKKTRTFDPGFFGINMGYFIMVYPRKHVVLIHRRPCLQPLHDSCHDFELPQH